MSRITEAEWAEFKFTQTDENKVISRLVRRLLPDDDSLIIDVGAGLGDIAEEAFPERKAILVDIADFKRSVCKEHVRRQVDFFDFKHKGDEHVTMLFSHVLQYLDEDVDKLIRKVDALSPRTIIVVCDVVDALQSKIFRWFETEGILYNAEVPIPEFPGEKYVRTSRIEFEGVIRTDDFATLADRLSNVIFDATMNRMQRRSFSKWLSNELAEPCLSIPQSIECFVRKGGT